MAVPASRIAVRNAAPIRAERDYVLYWMIATRRTRFSFGLQRAVETAVALAKPLVVLEPLRCDYRWASDRAHAFVIGGMAGQAERFSAAGIDYLSYVEPAPGAGKGLLEALARRACAVVTDTFPCFFLPRMVSAAAARLDVRLEAIDSNGLLPLDDADVAFPSAYAFRRHLQKRLPAHLRELPELDPLASRSLRRERAFPPELLPRWPGLTAGRPVAELSALPIDHRLPPVDGVRGGEIAASERLEEFVRRRLPRYLDDRNLAEKDGTSGLSPWLHFGHLSIHEIVAAIASHEGWSPSDVAGTASGRREGWWGLSAAAESFLDEAVTWRELGLNFCARRGDYDRFDSLPAWALATLASHAGDKRESLYSFDELDAARTHDPLWNAAQTQLVREGRIHNYLRMLWGKKILEWTASPEEAADAMIELNNTYALDGRDPNSYSGIFWVLGRYDRPWAPERPVFGVVRYMSSTNTARKMDVRAYMRRYSSAGLF